MTNILSLSFLLLFPALLLAQASPTYTSMGIHKPGLVVLSEFAAATNQMLDAIRYIQLYDVSAERSVWPATALITLSNIEVKNLKVAKSMTSSDLGISISPGSSATITGLESLAFRLESDISMAWSYTINGFKVYRGTITGKLTTQKPSVNFVLNHGKNTWTGNFGFTYSLTLNDPQGFGANNLVKTHVLQIFTEKCFSVLTEELNRYNDVILAYVQFNYFYRSIPLPATADGTERVLNNAFSKFFVNEKPVAIDFIFNSSYYEPLKHESKAVIAEFSPSFDTIPANSIELVFGHSAMKILTDHMGSKTKLSDFEITPEQQEKSFNFSVTVRMLGTFYPALLDRFDARSKLTLNCTSTSSALPGALVDYTYKCFFKIAGTNTQVLSIEKLILQTEFSMAEVIADADVKNITFGMKKFRYTGVVLPTRLPVYLEAEFLAFMQPFATWLGSSYSNYMPIVGSDFKWTYKGNATDDQKSFYGVIYNAL